MGMESGLEWDRNQDGRMGLESGWNWDRGEIEIGVESASGPEEPETASESGP